MVPPANADALVLDLSLRPYELLAAWRPGSRTLVLGVSQPALEGQRVVVGITVLGLGVAATITGRALVPRGHVLGFELELEPDATRLRALERLVEVAQGAPVAYRTRAPRLLAEVPAVVIGPRGPTRMTTFAISENGCGLAWTGPVPEVGVPMEIHLSAGSRVASFCGEVCWTAPSGRAPTVGVKFAAGDRTTWSRYFAELKAAGAPPA